MDEKGEKKDNEGCMQVNIQNHGLSDEQNVSLVGFQPSHREPHCDLWEEAGARRECWRICCK